MSLILQVTGEQRKLLGDDAVFRFGQDGGTIGRNQKNSWVLPDINRYVSSRHATIDFQGGAYYLLDTSSNGVFMNGANEPVGKGRPQRIFNGDKIRIGEYVMTVDIDEGESLVVDKDYVDSVVLKQFVEEEQYDDDTPLVAEEDLTSSRLFESQLRTDPDTGHEFADNFTDTFASLTASVMPSKPAKAPRPRKKNHAGAGEKLFSDQDAFDAFLQGLGISREDLGRSTDPKTVMHQAGQALREFIVGSTVLLQSRSELKNTFRLEQTTISPRQNNPLKFTASAKDTIRNLLAGDKNEFGGVVENVRDVCLDIKHHQDAVFEAMRASFDEFTERLDPDELVENFDRTIKRGSILGATNKMKYWDLYCDLYHIITQRPHGQFPHIFGEEFAKVYEETIRKKQKALERGTRAA